MAQLLSNLALNFALRPFSWVNPYEIMSSLNAYNTNSYNIKAGGLSL